MRIFTKKHIKIKSILSLSLLTCTLLVVFPSLAMAVDIRGNIQNKEYVVGWGTLALINAGIAQGKNRSGFNWFMVTLLLGPFATFLLVMSEKNPHMINENKDIGM